jgi:phosphoglycerate dehydrogenase-like enzyme
MTEPPVVALGPEYDRGLAAAIETGGGRVGRLAEADALVLWNAGDESPDLPADLPERVRWVQLPAAGVERWVADMGDGRVFPSATGAFALPVAEHALALMLAAARRIHRSVRAREWIEQPARSLEGATIAIVGAGGIGRALIELLEPLHPRILAVTRRGNPVAGAETTVPADKLDDVLGDASFVVLAAPGSPSTRQLIDAGRLARMRSDAWLVNVGRGSLVDTDALADALREGRIGGAALDVTDPEPLPAGHPLWAFDDVIITPHVATTKGAEKRLYAQRVRENVARFAAGEELLGVVDVDAGY